MAITLASLAVESNSAGTQLRAPQQYGTKKRRALTFTFVGDGASKTVNLQDLSSTNDNAAKISGITNVERIEIVEAFHGTVNSLPLASEALVDLSAGLPGVLTFSAAPGAAIIAGRVMVYGF